MKRKQARLAVGRPAATLMLHQRKAVIAGVSPELECRNCLSCRTDPLRVERSLRDLCLAPRGAPVGRNADFYVYQKKET